MKSISNLLVRIKKAHVIDFCAFFEYFEGLTAIRTPAPEKGEYNTLHIMVANDFIKEFNLLLKNIKGKMPWTLINSAKKP
jgi:hypothetical protein